ncbi:MAG: ABC transporter permease [Lachnospiraceae bacterium]|nr:ABC transporter permease [Lachnospiraceae bacterium]
MNRRKAWRLCVMQAKVTLQYIPAVLGKCLLLAVVLVGFVAGASYLLKEQDSEMVSIAVVIEDTNQMTGLAVDFLSQEEAVRQVAEFRMVSMEEGRALLEAEEVTALVLLPENFMDGIMYGHNVAPQIFVKDEGSNTSSGLFRSLIDSAATDLATAQAVIYAVDNLCYSYGIDAVAESEDYFNKELLFFALSRNRYLGQEVISVTGELPVVSFYLASAMLLLVLLAGMSFGELYLKKNEALRSLLAMEGISYDATLLVRVVVSSFVLSIFLEAAYLLLVWKELAVWHWYSFFLLFLVVMLLLTVEAVVYRICNNALPATMIVFILGVGCLYFSGNLVPMAMLSEGAASLAPWMPTTYLTKLLGYLFV